MKQSKQRVIAIDYFRGVCILMVLLSHAYPFSLPFGYLTGLGHLWTSAAEMFFLISGITLWIVRGESIQSDFRKTAKKIWRRAAIVYILNILAVVLTIFLIPLLQSKNLTQPILGPMPTNSGLRLFWDILTFHYVAGLAGFLMYYSVYLLFAPFILFAMRTRFWGVITLSSALLFMLTASQSLYGTYTSFGLWQFYLILGVTIARFRISILRIFYGLPPRALKYYSIGIISTALLSTAVAALVDFNVYPMVVRLVNEGWLPIKLQSAYSHLLNHQFILNFWLFNDRHGVLRPVFTLLTLAAAYILYQRYKQPLLQRTGNFINGLGRDTLWIFFAQALVIPVLAILQPSPNLFTNTILTASLVMLMWLLTKRRIALEYAKAYLGSLRDSYNDAKYNYLQSYEES